MAKKGVIQFENLQLTVERLMEKLSVERAGYLAQTDLMLTGLERFHDIWKDNREVLNQNPALFKLFANIVKDLADGYLKSGDINDHDQHVRAHIRRNVVLFRDEVNNAWELSCSHEVQEARTFVDRTVKKVPAPPKDDFALPQVDSPAGVINLTINVSRGGTVFIGTPQPVNVSSDNIDGILSQGPQPKGRSTRKK